ncbi:MAG: methyltransferase [Deltaproteobacteria bacterium]|nr:methyltransferase [Deltaproteobacteria bacterium]
MRDQKRVFKDWVMPGPTAPGGQTAGPGSPETGPETLDALSGLWRIFQYERGHRFSTDDLLTAWYGTSKCPSAGRALDLGSGIGSVGMMAAWRLQGATFVTLEAQDISVRLARKSARHNGIEPRYEILQGDIRDERLLAGREPFDLVLGSPPYFPLGTGIEGEHPQTIPCRFEVRGDVSHYCAAAARNLAPGGLFAFVFPTEQLERANAAAAASGLTIVTRRDVVFREGNAPLVSLFACALASDLPLTFRDKTFVEPALVVRTAKGEVHPEYRAVKYTMGFRP